MTRNAEPNYNDNRTFLYLKDWKKRLWDYFNSDPRFTSCSACAIHLFELGIKADKKARDAALEKVE